MRRLLKELRKALNGSDPLNDIQKIVEEFERLDALNVRRGKILGQAFLSKEDEAEVKRIEKELDKSEYVSYYQSAQDEEAMRIIRRAAETLKKVEDSVS